LVWTLSIPTPRPLPMTAVGRGLSASVEAEVNDARVMMGYPNPTNSAESAEAMKIKVEF
jgi:hypothetical protein